MAATCAPIASNLVVSDFVNDAYKITHYELLAERVHDICKDNLPKDIQAIVTFRCKTRKSLQKKLLNINESRTKEGRKPFQDSREIEKSIFDLAGVRIALYVPQQKERVIKEIDKWFPTVIWKGKRGKAQKTYLCKGCGEQLEETECQSCRNKPGRSSTLETPTPPHPDEIYNPVFAGYIADHARVKLSKDQKNQQKRLEDWKEDHIVEIQVVSVLLHAWAEVEHDIIYKSIKAKAGMEERKILDSLNGFIISSELLLDQLHSIHTNRVESMRQEFSSKFALAAFLDGYIGDMLSENEKNNLELKTLFGLLKVMRKDSQQELQPVLEGLGFKQQATPEEIDTFLHEPNYTNLVHAENSFSLAPHMRIPFYIMQGILSQISDEDEREARKTATKSGGPVMENNSSYQCRILLSSFVWMGQLSLGNNALGVMELIRPADENEKHAFEWPFSALSRFKILVNGKSAKEEDARVMDILWKWFERQESDSFFSFVFRISRLGVIASFPDDLALLRKGYSQFLDPPERV